MRVPCKAAEIVSHCKHCCVQSQALPAPRWRVHTGLLLCQPLALRECQAENGFCLQARGPRGARWGSVSRLAHSTARRCTLTAESSWHGSSRESTTEEGTWGKEVHTGTLPCSLLSASIFTPSAGKRWVGMSEGRGRNCVAV